MLIEDQEEISHKGRPTTCRYCKHKFHVTDKIIWEQEKHTCPECAEIWSDKPETERMLMILQDEYFKKRSRKILDEMVNLLTSYCESLIKKSFSNKIQEPGKCEYFAHAAVSFLIEGYLNPDTPEFRVQSSFAGMLFPKIQQAIFGKQEYDCAHETLDFEFEDGNQVVYEDNKKSIFNSLQDRHSKEQLISKLCELIFGIENYCTQEENYIILLNIRNYIIGGEKYTDRFFNNSKSKVGKFKFLKSLGMIRDELIKMDRENN